MKYTMLISDIFMKRLLSTSILCVSLMIQFHSVAQLYIGDQALITLSEESLLYLPGGLENGGHLANNGNIYVGGNWKSSGNYESGVGAVTLISSQTQSIDHQNSSIFQLNVEGGGQKLLLSDLGIAKEGVINFKNGLIRFGGDFNLVVEENVEVLGGNETSYVVGKLFHKGLGRKIYPIGNEHAYYPVILEDVDGVNPILGFEVIEEDFNPTGEFEIEEISSERYWRLIIPESSGQYNGSTISLSLVGDESLGPLDETIVIESDSPSGEFSSIGKSYIGSQWFDQMVTSEALARGQIFTLGSSSTITLDGLLFVPNVFSPFSSNPEERSVKVYGKEVSDNGFSFKVYDRWGNQIYQTTSFQEANQYGWSIRDNHQLRGLQSFRYTLNGTFSNGRAFSKVGSIRLIK